MKPSASFPQANIQMKAPPDMESCVGSIPAYRAIIQGGPMDGSDVFVLAWRPSEKEIEEIRNGACVYLTCIGSTPPHLLSTSFEEALNL